jgi:hypothetical protein
MKKSGISIVAALLIFLLIFSIDQVEGTALNSVVDFESLQDGSLISEVSSGYGISGNNIAGSIAINVTNPAEESRNAAMIFNADCGGQCTGHENSLEVSQAGKALIAAADFDPSDPDSADITSLVFDFNFSNWGIGEVAVKSIDLINGTGSFKYANNSPSTLILYSSGEDGKIVKTHGPC